MCNLSAGIEEKGIAKGMVKGIEKGIAKGIAKGIEEGVTKTYLASIKSLMEEMSMSAEKAMAVLRIPEEERPKYLELLGQEV